MSNVAHDVQVVREMVKQGVPDLYLKGLLGATIRAERRPVIKDLVRRGLVSSAVLQRMDEADAA